MSRSELKTIGHDDGAKPGMKIMLRRKYKSHILVHHKSLHFLALLHC
jgi:hypothetical protein